ncbi:MAG: family 78 glycoside hydrolase catalytic domain [Chitinophagaceae bacterium]
MMRQLLFFLFIIISLPSSAQDLSLDGLICEGRVNPVGVGAPKPKFSWQIVSNLRNSRQTAYRILVSGSMKDLIAGKGEIWDSGKKMTAESVQVEYAGVKLKPATRYFWKVQCWDNRGQVSFFSPAQHFTTGLYEKSDWAGAKWIGYEDLEDSMRVRPGVHGDGNSLGEKALKRSVSPLFRKEFTIAKPVRSAVIFISGLGQYEMEVNGQKYGDDFLSPGWTNYDKTCLYNSYDIGKQLKQGKNALGVIVGNGFYYVNRERYRKMVTAFGMPKMICRLVIRYTDGKQQTIISGTDWKTSPSPVTYNSIYGGEDYDARMEQANWSGVGFDDGKWKQALAVREPTGKLVADQNYPVRVNQSLKVRSITHPKAGIYMYDFGQNASGILEIKVQGKRGDTIKIFPSELINAQLLANQSNTGAPYYFFYTLKGEGVETWRPRFTYYGFRYAQVEGAHPDSVAGAGASLSSMVFLHTGNSAPVIGNFTSSNQLFNKTFTLIDWAIKSNLQSVVTDCPHREKLSWLEEDYLMGGSIHYNYDVYPLYRKLIYDMMDAQTDAGLIPDISPEFVEFGGGFRDSPEWGSAGVVLPWMLYTWYGDKDIVRTAYPMMKRYVNYLEGKSTGHILSYGLGDWYDLGPNFPGSAQLTPIPLTATATFYYDASLLSKMAGLIGIKEDSMMYSSLAGQIKEAFNRKFYDAKSKVYATGSQTSMAMPLVVGLVDDHDKPGVVKNLIDSIYANGKALTAGDVGYHYLVKALADNGGSQLLFDMNNRDDVPGYGYQIKKGATSLTESWPALREVSNNHLMLGHIMEWFYSGLGGIGAEDDAIAFNKLIIRPNPVGDITWTKCSFVSPYGSITSNWSLNGENLDMEVVIPPNTSATVYVPKAFEGIIKEGSVSLDRQKDILQSHSPEGVRILKIGSGSYHFTVSKKLE